jgi:glycosyltransferase involved in cell wall biosynthesis
MHIGFDAKRLFQNTTGLGNYSRSLVSGLQMQFPQHSYTLFAPKIVENAHTKPFLQAPFKTVAPTLFKNYWRTRGCVADIKRCELDVFHGLSHEIPMGVPKNIKTVVTVHDLIWRRYPEMYGLWDRNLHDLKCKYACQNADKIVAISESTKQDIMEFYGVSAHKIEVIYQTCNPIFYNNFDKNAENTLTNEFMMRFSIHNPANAPYLLYVGSIIERKNLLNLAKAMTLLPKNLADTPLYIVGGGKGAYFEKVKAFVATNNLTQRIVFLKNVSDADLAVLYHNAAAFVYPSVYEGFGIPILEALFSGAPVITSTQLALTEAAGAHSLCLDVRQPALIADAIQNILENTALANTMRSKGLLHAQQFLPQGLAQQMMSLYVKLLDV